MVGPHLPAGEAGDAARRRTDDSHGAYGAIVLDRGEVPKWRRIAGIVGAGVCCVGVALVLSGSFWRRDALGGQVGAAGGRSGGVSATLAVRSQLIGDAPKPAFDEANSDPEESVEGSQADEALAKLMKAFDSTEKKFDVGSLTGCTPPASPLPLLAPHLWITRGFPGAIRARFRHRPGEIPARVHQ